MKVRFTMSWEEEYDEEIETDRESLIELLSGYSEAEWADIVDRADTLEAV